MFHWKKSKFTSQSFLLDNLDVLQKEGRMLGRIERIIGKLIFVLFRTYGNSSSKEDFKLQKIILNAARLKCLQFFLYFYKKKKWEHDNSIIKIKKLIKQLLTCK